MNKIVFILCFFIITSFFVNILYYNNNYLLNNFKAMPKEKSIWIWNSSSEMDQEFLDKMFINLKKDNFNVIKIQIDDVLSFYNINKNNFELNKYENYKQELNEIVRQAKIKGFEVDVIAGNKDWLLPKEQYKPLAITNFVIAYNKDSGQKLKIRYNSRALYYFIK